MNPTTKPTSARKMTKYPEAPSREEMLYQSTAMLAITPLPNRPTSAVRKEMKREANQLTGKKGVRGTAKVEITAHYLIGYSENTVLAGWPLFAGSAQSTRGNGGP